MNKYFIMTCVLLFSLSCLLLYVDWMAIDIAFIHITDKSIMRFMLIPIGIMVTIMWINFLQFSFKFIKEETKDLEND